MVRTKDLDQTQAEAAVVLPAQRAMINADSCARLPGSDSPATASAEASSLSDLQAESRRFGRASARQITIVIRSAS